MTLSTVVKNKAPIEECNLLEEITKKVLETRKREYSSSEEEYEDDGNNKRHANEIIPPINN